MIVDRIRHCVGRVVIDGLERKGVAARAVSMMVAAALTTAGFGVVAGSAAARPAAPGAAPREITIPGALSTAVTSSGEQMTMVLAPRVAAIFQRFSLRGSQLTESIPSFFAMTLAASAS